MTAVAAILLEIIRRRAPLRHVAWLGEVTAALDECPDRERFLIAFAEVSRRLGRGALALGVDESAQLGSAGLSWPIDAWAMDEIGRVALLVRTTARLDPATAVALVEDCYGQGELRERQAVLRGLALLPPPDRLLPTALDACRSHVQPVFEAIACENPYPADHFPETHFNHMVLKAISLGIPVSRILALETRVGPELARMAADYASERRAAGRPIPADAERLSVGGSSR